MENDPFDLWPELQFEEVEIEVTDDDEEDKADDGEDLED